VGKIFHEIDECELVKKGSRERDAGGKKVATRGYLEEGRGTGEAMVSWRVFGDTFLHYVSYIVKRST
jgi:hypothetical protein